MTKVIVASYTKELKNIIYHGVVDRDLKVVMAYNLVEAASMLDPQNPNVIVFDLDSGNITVNYLKLLLNKYNLLVILTGSHTKKAFDYFPIGIKDFIIKPDDYDSKDAYEYTIALGERIKSFARTAQAKSIMQNRLSLNKKIKAAQETSDEELVIAIASSTGGTEALEKILTVLPEDMPPILIVQHMPKLFVKQFAQRLDKFCKLNIKEALSYEAIERGTVYFAPGDFHMVLSRRGSKLAVESKMGNKVLGVRPSADVLFDSVAEVAGKKAVGVILTGMGSDGARGLYAMRNAGARTIGQDKATSAIYGMPAAAYDLGAVEKQVPLSQIANCLIKLSSNLKGYI